MARDEKRQGETQRLHALGTGASTVRLTEEGIGLSSSKRKRVGMACVLRVTGRGRAHSRWLAHVRPSDLSPRASRGNRVRLLLSVSHHKTGLRPCRLIFTQQAAWPSISVSRHTLPFLHKPRTSAVVLPDISPKGAHR